MEIVKLDRGKYAGRKFTVRYTIEGYYDIIKKDSGFDIKYKRFDKPTEKSFDDCFMGKWLEDPVGYGAFEGEKMIGYVEGSIESWNRRYRINNIVVFDKSERRKGIGSALMNAVSEEAVRCGARMIVLETQTCNEKAINFYLKNGFSLIGFDLYSYTNSDPERKEVRIEMGKKLR